MNYKMIKYTLGWILLFEAAFFVLPIVTGIVFSEREAFSFLWSLLIAGGVGALLILRKPANTNLYSRDGFVIVALSWMCISLFGSFPFLFSGATHSFVDALFETVSGFTTTGSSIFTDIEALPKCLIMWRSFTHWIGGMGVLVFIMAFLPLGGAHNINIMKAESTGPSVSKLVPRVRTTAFVLYFIYFAMTFVLFIMLLFGGNSFFESINIAFSTAGTGGFGIYSDSMNSFSSYTIIVVTVFMFLYSFNFASYYLAMHGRFKEAFNTEIKVFITIVLVAITVISADNYINDQFASLGESIKHSAFTVSSIISTTGFATADFNLWPNLSKTILVLLMFVGACAGSTGGGIKVSRIVILFKGMARELKMLVHPKQVKKISVDSHKVDHEVVRSINSYIVCFVTIFFLSTLILSFEETDLVTNFTAVAASLNNIGPGLEAVGPYGSYAGFSPLSKLTLIFDMLAGRLEIFPMLILFSRETWKK